jgi:hypothetical protein
VATGFSGTFQQHDRREHYRYRYFHALGTAPSAERFKNAIKPMDKASEAILALKPVPFHYNKEIDPEGIPQFGLVAEQVEKVNPIW